LFSKSTSRPYQYALERAISDQAALEGQIEDERRRIAALVSAVSVSQANIQGTEADVTRSGATVDQARADVANAEQAGSRAKAEWTYANNNLHRIEPLLSKQFVTVDQVDRARTTEVAQAQALNRRSLSSSSRRPDCNRRSPNRSDRGRCSYRATRSTNRRSMP